MQRVKKWMKRAVRHLTKQELEVAGEKNKMISEKMREAIALWTEMYDNSPPWQGENVKSLNLPAVIAAETARLATLEMQSEVSGGERARYLEEMYRPVLARLRRYVEYGCAKGGLVLKPYVCDGNILVDFVQADAFYPTAFDSSGNIISAVFTDKIRKGDKIFTRLERHSMEGDGYHVSNRAYVSRVSGEIGHEIPLSEVAQWEGLAQDVVIQNLRRPLFAYFKVPFANAVDTNSPLGVSVYARAVDLIKEADKQYSRLLWEFESGERALYVSDTAFRLDENGRVRIPDKRLYRLLGIEQGGDDLFSDWSPTLREKNILRGLNAILRKIEFNCGLAYGTLSDVDNVDKTAEEIRFSKQRSYSMICDIQKEIRYALCGLLEAMDALCSLYHLAPEGSYEASFDFDDSIVADRATEFAEKQQLLQDGILQPWEFRMWYFGETEQQAKAAVGARVFRTDIKESGAA